MIEDQQKRGRSDTVSTTLSDSHDTKGTKLTDIQEQIFFTSVLQMKPKVQCTTSNLVARNS
jgi:hypothetical protein